MVAKNLCEWVDEFSLFQQHVYIAFAYRLPTWHELCVMLLPKGLTVKGSLDLRYTNIMWLPDDLVVEGEIFMPDAV